MSDDILLESSDYRGQSAMARANVYGRLISYSLQGIFIECVCVAIRFPSDEKNKTGEIEYDLDPLSMSFPRLINAVNGGLGVNDGEETIYRVSTARPDASGWDPEKDSRDYADGDRVLVTFINGSFDRPVIIKRLTQLSTVIGTQTPADKSNMNTRTLWHRGTKLTLDGNGNLDLLLDKDANKVSPTDDKKKLTVTIGSLQIVIDNSSSPTTYTLKLKGGNSIATFTGGTSGSDPEIDFGSGADQHMVLGEALMTKLNDQATKIGALATELAAHTHLGNLGLPTSPPVDAAAFATFASQFTALATLFGLPAPANTMLSEWMKSKKGKP